MAVFCKPCKVTGLSSLVALHSLCQDHGLTLSQDTSNAILYDIIRRLGPDRADKVVEKLIELGELDKNNAEYEVEKILDKRWNSKSCRDEYLVKWKRWPSSSNTWEPIENLENCEQILATFKLKPTTRGGKRKRSSTDEDIYVLEKEQLDQVFTKLKSCERQFTPSSLLEITKSAVPSLLPAKILQPKLNRQLAKAWATNKRSKTYKEHKATVTEALKFWEKKINSITPNYVPILVENEVDLEGPPENFEFVQDYIANAGVVISNDPPCGCECGENCSATIGSCCPHNSGATFAYTMAKRVRLPVECRNRVVQNGRQVKLSIFRTTNGCGWGVKTRQKIKKGAFVMEYIGEVITNEVAEKRGQKYDAEGFTYLFDLDFNDDDCPFTIDARDFGNESHFVNHSCEPNMSVYGVWINNLDVRLPRIALFANRDINRDEELTFDYKMTGDTTADTSGEITDEDDVKRQTPSKMSPFKSRNRPVLVSPSKKVALFSKDTTENKPSNEHVPTQNGISAEQEGGSAESQVQSERDNSISREAEPTDSKSLMSVNAEDDDEEVRLNINTQVCDVQPLATTDDIKITTDPEITQEMDAIPVGGPDNSDVPVATADISPRFKMASTTSDDGKSATGVDSTKKATKGRSREFSCTNHRVVCRCGAKSCRGFLF